MWIPRYAAEQSNRFEIGVDGRTPEERRVVIGSGYHSVPEAEKWLPWITVGCESLREESRARATSH